MVEEASIQIWIIKAAEKIGIICNILDYSQDHAPLLQIKR